MTVYTKVRSLVLNAVLIALTLILGLTPIGLIPLGVINLTIIHIPVIFAAVYLGLKSGLIMGFVFGSCSFMSALGMTMTAPSALASALGAENPFLLCLMCYIPRLLIPVAAYLINRALAGCIKATAAEGIASVLGSLTNSLLYLGLMCVFYKWAGLDTGRLLSAFGIQRLSFFGLIAVIFTGAGICEALAAGIIVPSLIGALNKTSFGRKYTK